MDFRALAALITRTAGLVLVVIALADFPYRFANFAYVEVRTGITFLGTVVLPFGVPLTAGVLLMWLPGRISSALIGSSADSTPEIPQALQGLVFAAIGLYVAVDSLLDLIWYGTLYGMAQNELGYDVFADPQNSAGLVTAVIGLVLGLVLILGAKGLANAIRRLRGRE